MTKFKLNTLTSLVVLFSISLFISCSKTEELIEQEQNLIDLRKVEISKEGLNPVFEVLESNFKKDFKGELLNASIGIEKNETTNLRSSIDYTNAIHLELMSDNGEVLNVYSSPSLENPNETIAFAVNNGVVTDEVKFIFKENSDGTFNFETVVINESARGWFSCMAGAFDDDVFGTTVTLLGVAGGVGCVPCGIAGAVLTGFAGIGCLAAI